MGFGLIKVFYNATFDGFSIHFFSILLRHMHEIGRDKDLEVIDTRFLTK